MSWGTVVDAVLKPFSKPGAYGFVEKTTSLAPPGAAADVRAWGPDPWASIVAQGRGVRRPFNSARMRALAKSESVQLCVSTLVDDVTSIDWHITSRTRGEKADPKDTERVTEFLEDANPNYSTFRDTLEATLIDMLEIGNGVWVKTFTRGGKLAYFDAYDAETFFVEPDKAGIVTGFYQYPRAPGGPVGGVSQTFPAGGQPVPFTPEEVSWFTYGRRTDRHYGKSPVETLDERLTLIALTLGQELAYFKEGSIPPGLLALFGEAGRPAEADQVRDFIAEWNANIKGKPHKLPFWQGDAKYIPFGYNYQELQFLERQEWYQKLVCAMFKVPPAYLGLAAESTNRATDVSQMANYKRKALRPQLLRLEEVINQTLIWPYVSPKLKFEFKPTLDIAEMQALATVREIETRGGWRTINEIRSDEGLDPVAWGNEPHPATLAPTFDDIGAAGEEGAQGEATAAEGDVPPEGDETGEAPPAPAPAAAPPEDEEENPMGNTPRKAVTATPPLDGPDLQRQGLNGAQIAAIVDVAARVSIGELDRAAAVGIVGASFPWLTPEDVERMVPAQGTRKPDPPEEDDPVPPEA